MLMAPVATKTCRHFHIKFTLAAGILCMSGGFIAASFTNHIWQLFLSQGVLVGMGCGLIYVPSLPIVSQWFGKRRGLANGITSAGSGIGGVSMSFAIQAIIERLGVAWALRITGIVVLAVNVPACAVLRTRDHYIFPNRRMFDLALLRRYDVCLFLSWGFVMMFGYITLTYSLSDYGRSIGLSDTRAGYQTAFNNLGNFRHVATMSYQADGFSRRNCIRPPIDWHIERQARQDRGGWFHHIPYRHPLLCSLDSRSVFWTIDVLLYREWVNSRYLLAGQSFCTTCFRTTLADWRR
jgi:MFS family permease